MTKPKILYISSVKAAPTTGGSLVLYRHLVARDDFEVIFYDDEDFNQANETEFPQRIWAEISKYLLNTRLYSLFLLCDWYLKTLVIPGKITKIVKKHKPEVIITVAQGDLFWVAKMTARKFHLPLITIFHDWWPEFCCLPNRVTSLIDRRMRIVHKESCISLAVCDGMKNELGRHPDCRVLYPIPGENIITPSNKKMTSNTPEKLRMIYAGNTSGAYGCKLLNLMRILNNKNSNFELSIYTGNCDWPASDQLNASNAGILKKFIPHSELIKLLPDFNLLLVVMGGEQSLRFCKTSFPSKTVDYIQSCRPIVAWAPPDSSIAKFLQHYNCGMVIHDESPAVFLEKVVQFAENKDRVLETLANADRTFNEVLHPTKIHSIFHDAVMTAIDSR